MELLFSGFDNESERPASSLSFRRGSQRVGGLGRIARATRDLIISASAGTVVTSLSFNPLQEMGVAILDRVREQTPQIVYSTVSICEAVAAIGFGVAATVLVYKGLQRFR